MSIITKIISNIILLIIALTWALLSISEGVLMAMPDNIMWIGAILFAGDRGIDILIQRMGLNAPKNSVSKSSNTST